MRAEGCPEPDATVSSVIPLIDSELSLWKSLRANLSCSWICMQRFIAGVTSLNTANIASTKSTPVAVCTSLSRIG